MSQSKINDLKKKRAKVEKELQAAKQKFEQQKVAMNKKEDELKRADADLVSTLLVENNLTMNELADLLAESSKPVMGTGSNAIPDLGGEE